MPVKHQPWAPRTRSHQPYKRPPPPHTRDTCMPRRRSRRRSQSSRGATGPDRTT